MISEPGYGESHIERMVIASFARSDPSDHAGSQLPSGPKISSLPAPATVSYLIRTHGSASLNFKPGVTAILLLLSLPVLAGKLILPALNSAICWELFHFFNLETQSAGNLLDLNLMGILRDYTPELTVVNITMVKQTINSTINKESNYNKFGSYLAGLIEGDGTIIVPKTDRSTKGKLNYPSIQIVFNLRDFPLGQLIQKELGFGSLSRKKGVNAYILSINNKEGIIKLVNLLNGYMRTPKINSLYNLID